MYPTLGRFSTVDPMCEKHPEISPYVYCAGNPVNLIDPDGRDWYRHDKSGATFWQEGNANSFRIMTKLIEILVKNIVAIRMAYE